MPTPLEDEDFIFSMSQDEAKKLDYIKRKNDVDFATRHPQYFTDSPGSDMLQADSETYTQLINAVMHHQVQLAKGQFPTPEVFDPAKVHLTEPPFRHFTRKPEAPLPPALVTVPDFRGRFFGTDIFEEAQRVHLEVLKVPVPFPPQIPAPDGFIIDQNPKPGPQMLPPGIPLILSVVAHF